MIKCWIIGLPLMIVCFYMINSPYSSPLVATRSTMNSFMRNALHSLRRNNGNHICCYFSHLFNDNGNRIFCYLSHLFNDIHSALFSWYCAISILHEDHHCRCDEAIYSSVHYEVTSFKRMMLGLNFVLTSPYMYITRKL